MDDKTKELVRRLKALAERGIDGEKVTAEKFLKSLMKKFGFSEQDLVSEEVTPHTFIINKHQMKLFIQIVCKITDTNGVRIGKVRYAKSGRLVKDSIAINLTAVQAVEIQLQYEFYWKLFCEELDVFTLAFFTQNELYSETHTKDSYEEATAEERAKHRRVSRMAENITQGHYRKQLTD